MLTEKKKTTHTHTQPKSWEYCFIWGHYWELYRLGKRPSQKALRKCSKEVREKPIYRSFGWNKWKSKKTKHFVQHQKITANHKTQTSWVNHFSVFLCMERCKILGMLKLFLWYASELPRTSLLLFSILNLPQGVLLEAALWLMTQWPMPFIFYWIGRQQCFVHSRYLTF